VAQTVTYHTAVVAVAAGGAVVPATIKSHKTWVAVAEVLAILALEYLTVTLLLEHVWHPVAQTIRIEALPALVGMKVLKEQTAELLYIINIGVIF
jgi:hypothetical protein